MICGNIYRHSQTMNWTSIQQTALVATVQRRNERDIRQRQLTQTQSQLTGRQQEQALLRDQWEHEQADVDRLNRLSWASLYYDILNRKEEQISREEAEAQQARLRYDAICADVQELLNQLSNQQKQLADYASVDQDYAALIQAKQLALVSSSDAKRDQYEQHLATLTQHNHFLQELSEAHKAGLVALQEVMTLRKLFDQARNWGKWDLIGGSAISSMIKYEKLDDVRDQSYRVTRCLQQFQAEYADINQPFMADWQFDNNLTRFTDIFFDNIFTDWSVQNRIINGQKTAQALENQLVTSIQSLKSQIVQYVEQTKRESDDFYRFLEVA